MLVREGNQYTTVREGSRPAVENQLVPVFENGELLVRHSLREVRERATSAVS